MAEGWPHGKFFRKINEDFFDSLSRGRCFNSPTPYTVARTDSANLDVLMGLRYAGFDADTDLSLDGPLAVYPADGAAARFRQPAGRHHRCQGLGGMGWSLVFALLPHVGTGDTELTWQALAGVGYRWDWGDLTLTYRHLSYDMGSDKLLQNTEFSGPTLRGGLPLPGAIRCRSGYENSDLIFRITRSTGCRSGGSLGMEGIV